MNKNIWYSCRKLLIRGARLRPGAAGGTKNDVFMGHARKEGLAGGKSFQATGHELMGPGD